jgi:ribonuclease BN (tRNA processing enzyme)
VTQLQFLGTGTPNPDPNRYGPASAVLVNGSCYLVDAGAGVVRRAAAADIKMEQLNRLFITHLHSDHVLGYPDLILTPAVTGRKDALRVWGPTGTKEMTHHLLDAFTEDVSIRIHGGEPSEPAAYEVKVTEYMSGEIYRDENVSVTAFSVTHGKWQYAFGFRFDTKDRSIVFSGDTTYCDNLIEHAKGCDILVHEVCSSKGLAKRTPEWQKYHSSYHTIGEDVGRIATAVQPKLLLLNHLLPFGETDEQILSEVKSTYDGEVRIPNDLEVF